MSEILERLRDRLGDRVSVEREDRVEHSHDYWALTALRSSLGQPPPEVAAVVRPADTSEVSWVLAQCNSTGTPVIPYGLGSGVCGAIVGRPDAVVLSLEGLTGLRHLDEHNATARFGAGTRGSDAEAAVATDGFTLGHQPQSIGVSTVGGWVATRASGQFSTAYGNIENLITDIEVVLADGRVLRTDTIPRSATGPDLRQLFLGSEGTLGVVTEVGFSLIRRPESTAGQAFHFPDMDSGLTAIRTVLQAGWTPPVARLYDSRESLHHFPENCPEDRCALLWVHEGPEARVEVEIDAVSRLCLEHGAESMEPTTVDHWFEHRNRVSPWESFFERGIVLDTIEVGCSWDRAPELYHEAVRACSQVEGVLSVSAHSSHSYRSGTALYFTFLARPGDSSMMEQSYLDCWAAVMGAVSAVGGVISHHHGIGRVRRGYLVEQLGEVGVGLLRSVKSVLDPRGILNPGALIPDD